jgi:putative FmdB family regulatory protein
MPAYEYECQSCSGHFVQRQKMSESAVDTCPACGGGVKRLISGGAGIVSKSGGGSGGSQPAPRAACGMGEACCRQDMACGAGRGCIQ